MITVILENGEKYVGQNETEIMVQLKLEDWTNYRNPKEYKANIAKRIANFNGKQITYTNDKEFIHELKRIGFISQINDN